ncbi:MAG: hypothetical protein WCQ99_12180 [Pseudomonadota bacterium]
MKKLLVMTTILVLFAITAYNEDITIYDFKTGEYGYYDLEPGSMENSVIYDCKYQRNMDFEIESKRDAGEWKKNKEDKTNASYNAAYYKSRHPRENRGPE